MADESFASFASAHAGRYAFERELGRGGMAIVYLARDLRHHRQVALKVLRPEVTAALGTERFLREIEIAAMLVHPHIVPLIDSGVAAGQLYSVFPYVAGESLRERLTREGQLPFEDALRFTREVAEALSYAHAKGIVHRDIKPENILIESGHAVVNDFGIARAVSTVGGEQLTQTGIVIGTPAYMSPEQASGAARIDGRSDLYSLACVLYEMLGGEPPHTGPTPQTILARQLTGEVRSLRPLRSSVTPALDKALRRALAPAPADRFATMDEFVATVTTAASAPVRPPLPRWSVAAMIVAAVAAIGLLIAPRLMTPRTAMDPDMVAVLPFHVTGDSTFEYLHEGMIDLLAAEFTGEGTPHAADPQSVMRAWLHVAGTRTEDLPRAGALRIARGLGASRALLGTVVGNQRRLIIAAELVSVPSGRTLGSASADGPPDSLLGIIGRLTTLVLAQASGEDRTSLATIASNSLRSLRSYLEGKAAYRRGQYETAVALFQQALDQDSSFALAALGLCTAAVWTSSPVQTMQAWRLRGRLSARDRAILTALAGPRFPWPSSEREFLSAWQAAVIAAPTDPDAWYNLGDALYHAGPKLGEDRERTGAVEALGRAVALDSGFAAPLAHLAELAAQAHDAREERRLGALYLALDSAGEFANYLRWRIAIGVGDSSILDQIRGRMPTFQGESLRRIIIATELDGLPPQDADRAAALWAKVSDAPADRWLRFLRLHDLALNRGAPTEALAWTDSLAAIWPLAHAYLRIRVTDALFGGGSKAAASSAIDVLARSESVEPSTKLDREEADADVCVVELWRVHSGVTVATPRQITRLLRPTTRGDSTPAVAHGHWCAILLQASVPTRSQAGDSSLLRLDSLMLTGPRDFELLDEPVFESFAYGNLVASDLHERIGDLRGALAAIRRRPYESAGATYLAAYLFREGHLAMLFGDKEGAIRAYRHYLALRSRPEQALESEVEDVRSQLARLTSH